MTTTTMATNIPLSLVVVDETVTVVIGRDDQVQIEPALNPMFGVPALGVPVTLGVPVIYAPQIQNAMQRDNNNSVDNVQVTISTENPCMHACRCVANIPSYMVCNHIQHRDARNLTRACTACACSCVIMCTLPQWYLMFASL